MKAVILRKESYIHVVRAFSLNQGQGSVLRLGSARNRFPALKNLRIEDFLIKIRKYLIFTSILPPLSLNQGQGSVFRVRECAQSIFRKILPLYRLF